MQAKNVKVLGENEIRNLNAIIEKNYGARIDLSEFVVFETDVERKIWIAGRDISKIDMEKLNANLAGLYFGKIKRNDSIHLSIEGSQLVGRSATKNIVEVSGEEAERFLSGKNLNITSPKDCENGSFVIVKSGSDILGSGLLAEHGIRNLIPKSRKYAKAVRP